MKKCFLLTLTLLLVAVGTTSFHVNSKNISTLKQASTFRSPVNHPFKEVFLGTEIDQCSGSLSVKDKNNQQVNVPRGHWKTIDVAINGDGYWFWNCGNTGERSRGAENYRQRVKRLKVFHSKNNRQITWKCFDLL
jgi:hypothetical protein